MRGTKRGLRIIWSICAWDIFGGEINAISVLDDSLSRGWGTDPIWQLPRRQNTRHATGRPEPWELCQLSAGDIRSILAESSRHNTGHSRPRPLGNERWHLSLWHEASPDSRYVRLPENWTEHPTHWKCSGCQLFSMALTHSWHNFMMIRRVTSDLMSDLIPGWCTDHIWRKPGQTASCNHLGNRAYHALYMLQALKIWFVKKDTQRTIDACLPGSARLIPHTEQVKWCSW